MYLRLIALLVLLLTGSAVLADQPAAPAPHPNIVYILADDLGYGDLSCMNPQSKVHTANIDQLAEQGIRFTDAHAGAAVCTPTRYGILTGRYSWRTRLRHGVLTGFASHLIEPGRMTVASLLKGQGYHTACIGKWHLGLDWATAGAVGKHREPKRIQPEQVDFTRPFRNGPLSAGFDEFYGVTASVGMPPFVWLRNNRVAEIPSVERTIERTGPGTASFEAVDALPTVGRKATEYIDERAAAKTPFFLYLALTAPHAPVVPSKEFAGKTGIGKYADFVLQVDSVVGQVLRALERNELSRDTLVVFTSDNGAAPGIHQKQVVEHGHNSSYIFRGYKADIFEGGHRMPFLARWPDKIKPHTASDDTICLTDLLATCAHLVGVRLPDDAGEDSVSILPDLFGTAKGPAREATVHESGDGSLAIRQGKWKLALCPGSGGWGFPRPGVDDTSHMPSLQLYDLTTDIRETKNVEAQYPEVVTHLTELLQHYADTGRSTPGAPQMNDIPVDIRRGEQPHAIQGPGRRMPIEDEED